VKPVRLGFTVTLCLCYQLLTIDEYIFLSKTMCIPFSVTADH